MPVLRKAALSDAAALAELAERTFRATFAADNTEADMEAHCRASYSEAIQAGEIANPAMATLLVEGDGRLLAFAQLRWEDAPACVLARMSAKGPGEIQRLYVDREWHGAGIAQELMHACLEQVRARGSDVVWLGVWERNPRAMAFYRKFGFVEVGDHVFAVGTDPQRDILMARGVGDSRLHPPAGP